MEVLRDIYVSGSEKGQNTSSHLSGHRVSTAAVTNPSKGQIRTKSIRAQGKMVVLELHLLQTSLP